MCYLTLLYLCSLIECSVSFAYRTIYMYITPRATGKALIVDSINHSFEELDSLPM